MTVGALAQFSPTCTTPFIPTVDTLNQILDNDMQVSAAFPLDFFLHLDPILLQHVLGRSVCRAERRALNTERAYSPALFGACHVVAHTAFWLALQDVVIYLSSVSTTQYEMIEYRTPTYGPIDVYSEQLRERHN